MRGERDIERESEREKILVKSSKPRDKAQTKVDYQNYDKQLSAEIMRRNYYTKLLPSILCRGKCGNYRDTGVSKNKIYQRRSGGPQKNNDNKY